MYTGDNYAVWKTSRKPNKTYNTIELLILYCGRPISMDFKTNPKNLRLMSPV